MNRIAQAPENRRSDQERKKAAASRNSAALSVTRLLRGR
jgi:hypothetical protein